MTTQTRDMPRPERGGGACNSPGCWCEYGHPGRPDPTDLHGVRAAQMAPLGDLSAASAPQGAPAAQPDLEAGS
jgi:hypothetical protein